MVEYDKSVFIISLISILIIGLSILLYISLWIFKKIKEHINDDPTKQDTVIANNIINLTPVL